VNSRDQYRTPPTSMLPAAPGRIRPTRLLARARRVARLAVASALLLAALPGRAEPVAHDGFDLSFPVYAAGGSGFAGPWALGGYNAFSAGYALREASLCYRGLPGGGTALSGGAFPAINGILRPLQQPLGADNTTVYLSFLVRPEGTLGAGIYSGFFGLTLNGSLGADLFIGKPGGGALDRWVLETRGGYGQAPSGTGAVVGRVALLVVKAQFLPGRDTFTLYVNPAPGHGEPGSGIEKSDVDLGTVSNIGVYSSGAFTIDEIRIGTTFADVVPGPEPGSRGTDERCEDRGDGRGRR
jgi:hypothetical protein